jgi:hypothetical protein
VTDSARSGSRPILARPPEFVVYPLMCEIQAFRHFWLERRCRFSRVRELRLHGRWRLRLRMVYRLAACQRRECARDLQQITAESTRGLRDRGLVHAVRIRRGCKRACLMNLKFRSRARSTFALNMTTANRLTILAGAGACFREARAIRSRSKRQTLGFPPNHEGSQCPNR